MRRNAVSQFPVVAAVVLVAVAAVALPPATPERISYQGVLFDDQGQPRTGSVDLTLRIYDGLLAGTLIYAQSFTGVPLTDGVFTVELGPAGDALDGATLPLTTSLRDGLTTDLGVGAERFLSVSVGGQGPISRTQILSAPSALQAATADTAVTALDTASVGGLSSVFVTQLFEHGNSDGGGPLNNDPAEGLGDTDGDGLANFIDPDNDDDSLSDAFETSQGSDINLVTPIVTGTSPPSALAGEVTTVSVQGSNFEPGLSVVFGSQSPSPTNVTATSFDVVVGPQIPVAVPVQVTLPNGSTGLALDIFEFTGSVVSHPHPVQAGQLNLF